jgi:HdeA/HdeB family
MNGKITVILLSGLLFACAPETPAPSPPPPPPPAPAPLTEAMPVDRFVVIQRASCADLLKLSPDDRAAAAMFYIGYQSARVRAASVNVPAIPDVEFAAEVYCEDHPGRTAAQAFAVAYSAFR